MAFPRLAAPMLLASFILLLCWTTSSAESHDPTSADPSPPYRVKRATSASTRLTLAASSKVVKESLTVVKGVIEKIDTGKLTSMISGLAAFASLAPGIGALVTSVINVVLNVTPQKNAQNKLSDEVNRKLFAEVNRKLDSLSIQISNLATDVEWFNYVSVYSQDEVRILTTWNKFNQFREESALVDSEEAKLRLAQVFTRYYENTATEASVANLHHYLTVSSTSLSGNLNELLKKKFKCGIPEIGKYNLYFSSLLWKGMVLDQVYWNLIGLNPSAKEAQHTQMFNDVHTAQTLAVKFCLYHYKQYMIKDVEEITKAISPYDKNSIAVQVKNKLDEKYYWYKWVVLVYVIDETDHKLYNMLKIPVGTINVAVGYIQEGRINKAKDFQHVVDSCFKDISCNDVMKKIDRCNLRNPEFYNNVKVTHSTYSQPYVQVPESKYRVQCNWYYYKSDIHMYLSFKTPACQSHTCENGGMCLSVLDTNEHLCDCPQGFYGDRCQWNITTNKPALINTLSISCTPPSLTPVSRRGSG